MFLFGESDTVSDDIIKAAVNSFTSAVNTSIATIPDLQVSVICVSTSCSNDRNDGLSHKLSKIVKSRESFRYDFIENNNGNY